ncbi:hypothetical protein Mapa_001698 [Marchantia paleacea]|nr:hypothetical protein Mapa_001698 [Marchantia paleacea]
MVCFKVNDGPEMVHYTRTGMALSERRSGSCSAERREREEVPELTSHLVRRPGKSKQPVLFQAGSQRFHSLWSSSVENMQSWGGKTDGGAATST